MCQHNLRAQLSGPNPASFLTAYKTHNSYALQQLVIGTTFKVTWGKVWAAPEIRKDFEKTHIKMLLNLTKLSSFSTLLTKN